MLLREGAPTLISLTGSGVTFAEIEVTPPGVDGGGGNDTTTLADTLRTMYPKKTKTITKPTLKVAYDPLVYRTIMTSVNIIQLIIVTFPDARKLSFYGWLDVFKPEAMRHGERPVAEIEIVVSNQDMNCIAKTLVIA